MKWLLLCGVLATVSCNPTSPSDLPSAYAEVIRSEWSVAQRLLADQDVRSDLEPKHCTWIPHDGPLPYKGGYANGLFTPSGRIVRWNVLTPTVLRHEAGHAILYSVNHRCKSCWSVDSSVTLHPGKCESSAIGMICAAMLKELM